MGNRLTNQADDVVSSGTYNDLNQLASQTGGGPLRVRGHLDKPGTVKVNGQAAHMLAGNVFDTTINATSGVNTISVVATDVSGNVTSKNYQVTLSGIADTFTNDPNGNVTQKVEGGVTWTNTWDVEGHLTQVQNNGRTVATFAYDPLGRRIQKVAGGVTTTWTYDVGAILQQVSGGSTLKYIHGPVIDQPLASDDGTALSYFHADGLGSIVKTTNSAGAVTLSRQYDAWGNQQLGASTSGFAFTGREWDPETGLYYYRARYYDPKVGRFLSKDPVGFAAGPNYYTYVLDNPVNCVDPTGMYQCTYAIATHTMSCTPNNSAHATFPSSDDFVSGRSGAGCSDCQNNPNRTNVINWGPTPTGTYTIGGVSNGRRNLTPNPTNGRTDFQLHGCGNTATCSWGCIASPNHWTQLNNLLSQEEGNNTLTVTQ